MTIAEQPSTRGGAEPASDEEAWYTLTVADAAAHLGVQPDVG